MKIQILICLLTVLPSSTFSASKISSLQCKDAALEQANKLLNFHSDHDERIEIDQTNVKALPSIINPASPKQRFDVIEVWGYIYKGQYRMRFEYFSTPPNDCLLMGQEILEFAKL